MPPGSRGLCSFRDAPMQLDLSPYRFPIEWAEDVIAASATYTRCVLRYHLAEQYACADGVTLGYGMASNLLRAVAERIQDPDVRAGVINHLKLGMVKALEIQGGGDGPVAPLPERDPS